jgi:protein tyrosine phosphatase (PTP) superfamily phosphohydrolase (DUF442 family)
MRKAISQKVSVGEQPRQSDLEELKKDGVTTVVNLRVAGEDTSLTPAEERALAEKPVFVHCGMGQRACSFSLAASGVDADSIFEQAVELGFPVQDEKLKAFLKRL